MLSSPEFTTISECRSLYHRVRSLVLYNYITTVFTPDSGVVNTVKGPLSMTQGRSSHSSYSDEGAAEICKLLVDSLLVQLTIAVINHGNWACVVRDFDGGSISWILGQATVILFVSAALHL